MKIDHVFINTKKRIGLCQKITVYTLLFCIGSIALCQPIHSEEQSTEASSSQIQKSVTNIDRYKNFSTETSAIELQIRDTKTEEVFRSIVANYDFYGFLKEEKRFDKQKYIDYMTDNENKIIEVDLNKFKIYLARRWGIKKARYVEEHFKKYNLFSEPLTLEKLGVSNEHVLLNKYFDFNFDEGSGYLNRERFDKFNINPSFIALLINLGYEVTWDCYSGTLRVSTKPFIEIGGPAFAIVP